MNKILATLGYAIRILVIYLGLPLLGWGLGYIPDFFDHPLRRIYALLIPFQALAGSLIFYLSGAQEKFHPERFILGRWHLYAFETIIVLAAHADHNHLLTWNENIPLRVLGLMVYILGVVFGLGLSLLWMRARQPAQLFSQGIFKHLPPGYMALTLRCLGIACLFRSWVGLGLIAPLVLGAIHHQKNEQKVLAR